MSQQVPSNAPTRPEPSLPPAARPPRLELSPVKIFGGALAAASAAVASSWLGVAGTVFGAVVVSVVATVGTALYSHSLERSQYVIRESLPVLANRTRVQRDVGIGGDTMVLSVTESDPPRRRNRDGRPISWGTVAVSCVATLVLGFAVLTGFEAIVGESASQLTGSSSGGGTTLEHLVGGSDGSAHQAPSTPTNPTSPTTPTAPTTTGPTTTGPTTGPTSTGPTSTGPTSTGPTSTGPTSTGPTTPGTTGPGTTAPTQTQQTGTQPTNT